MNTDSTNPYRGVIAVTGVIGSGKSSVCAMLSELGATVISADDLAREVFEPGYDRFSEVIARLQESFPDAKEKLFDSQGRVIRQALAREVFASPEKTRLLNGIVHPEVRRLFAERVRHAPCDALIIYDIPLLFEAQMESLFELIVVVYAPEALCLERAAKRLGIAPEEVKNRLERQISIEKKRQMADVVVENLGSLEELRREVKKLRDYLANRVKQAGEK